MVANSVGELKRRLKEVGYREKAVEEILNWYS
jgi:SOS response regulatory protein OraA/RecX